MPQRIDTQLLKRLQSAHSLPEREMEITDGEQVGFVLKHLPSGAVRFYAIMGRGRRELVSDPKTRAFQQPASGLNPTFGTLGFWRR